MYSTSADNLTLRELADKAARPVSSVGPISGIFNEVHTFLTHTKLDTLPGKPPFPDIAPLSIDTLMTTLLKGLQVI
jgi:hypothetical protein